jgi:pimeloyl-ACP methyl ester carboxylesterase
MMTKGGEHSAISSYQDEQLSLFRIGRDEYLFAICGLDLLNMGRSPNSPSAVIRTATEHDPMANPYYRLIRARFLAYLAKIPPGSTINIAGHSMGGGMTMLLLNDPEIQAALVSGGYTLRSVVLYGAVRPQDPRRDGVLPSRPGELSSTILAGTEVRIYVDREDRLALNVGAGHMSSADRPLPYVYLLDNGDLNGATDAHTSYYSPDGYAGLPANLRELPFHIDPRYWEHYRSPDVDDVHVKEWLGNTKPEPVPLTPAIA